MDGINAKAIFAEFMGTAILVIIGCGSVVAFVQSGGRGPGFSILGIAMAFGLAVLMLAYSIGPISGCHVNPAVTLGAAISGRITPVTAATYVGAQFVGGIVGAFTLWLIAKGAGSITTMGANTYGHEEGAFTYASCFVAEIMLTFIFVMVVLGATAKKANAAFAGIAIGFALVAVHLVGIPITGTSVNPARSLGPAIFEGEFKMIGQFFLCFLPAPMIGGALAGGVSLFLFSDDDAAEE